MFFDKKAKEVEKLMLTQLDQIENVLDEMQLMITDYLKHDKVFKQESYEVHLREHKADKIRRKIGQMLYEGAFLPVYRESYFNLVEFMDKIANQAEIVCDYVTLTRPPVPDFLLEDFTTIVSRNAEHFKPLKKLIIHFITGKKDVSEIGKQIQEIESEIDTLQFHAIRTVFKSEMEKIDKFHLKSLIDMVCLISNLIEDVSDQVEIIAAKHRL